MGLLVSLINQQSASIKREEFVWEIRRGGVHLGLAGHREAGCRGNKREGVYTWVWLAGRREAGCIGNKREGVYIWVWLWRWGSSVSGLAPQKLPEH